MTHGETGGVRVVSEPAPATAVQIWVYIENEEAARYSDELSRVDPLVAGAVCDITASPPAIGAGGLVVRARHEYDVADLLGRHHDIFVPEGLTNAALLMAGTADFRGRLWLEDSYPARYALEKDACWLEKLAVGLVGTTPLRGWRRGAIHYAFWRNGASAEQMSMTAALAAGVGDVWVSITPADSVADRVLRVTDAAEAADVSRLFGGIDPQQLSSRWERRSCLAAARPLVAGHTLTEKDLTVVTAAGGVSPDLRPRVTGRRLRYSLDAGQPLTFGLFDC